MKNLIVNVRFKIRNGIARALRRVHLFDLARAVNPPIQCVNWPGTWIVGTGYIVAYNSTDSNAYTFTDCAYIRFGKTGIFRKILVTLGGARLLVGKRNMLPTLEIAISQDIAIKNMSLDPVPTPIPTIVVTDNGGNTWSNTGYLLDDDPQEVGPEKEIMRVLSFACAGVWT